CPLRRRRPPPARQRPRSGRTRNRHRPIPSLVEDPGRRWRSHRAASRCRVSRRYGFHLFTPHGRPLLSVVERGHVKSTVKVRKIVIGAVLAVAGLPLLLFSIAAASVYALNRTNGTVISSGQKREYLLYVPRSYDRARPTPLVISMHAAALWSAAQMAITHWNRVADEHGFIVVYPAGGFGRLSHAWITILVSVRAETVSGQPTRHAGPSIS